MKLLLAVPTEWTDALGQLRTRRFQVGKLVITVSPPTCTVFTHHGLPNDERMVALIGSEPVVRMGTEDYMTMSQCEIDAAEFEKTSAEARACADEMREFIKDAYRKAEKDPV